LVDMSGPKAFRITCRVQFADLEMTVMATSEEEAKEKATFAIEGGEASIKWGDEGDGVVRLDSVTDMRATEEE
jgi:hypothetical protein